MLEGETLARQPVFNIGITVDFGGVFQSKTDYIGKALNDFTVNGIRLFDEKGIPSSDNFIKQECQHLFQAIGKYMFLILANQGTWLYFIHLSVIKYLCDEDVNVNDFLGLGEQYENITARCVFQD